MPVLLMFRQALPSLRQMPVLLMFRQVLPSLRQAKAIFRQVLANSYYFGCLSFSTWPENVAVSYRKLITQK
jgi:hypothetical protein